MVETVGLDLDAARAARTSGNLAAARAAYEHLLESGEEELGVTLELGQVLLALGAYDALIQRFEAWMSRHGPVLALFFPLFQAYRGAGRFEDEARALGDALAAHPGEPRLLRYACSIWARAAEPGDLDLVLALIRDRAGPALADELELRALVQCLRYDEAVALIARRPVARRDPETALLVAEALFGAHRYRLALRYLAACLRSWPDHVALWETYIRQASGLGRLDEAAARLATPPPGVDRPAILTEAHRLAALQGDFAAAVEAFAALRKAGRLTPELRAAQMHLTVSLADWAELETLFDRIGPPDEGETRLLHRAGLAGLLRMELALERQVWAAEGGFDRLEDWVTARSGSIIPAIRLIDARQACGAGQGAVIPREIHQYWNMRRPPDAVSSMMASWQGQPGFAHQLWDRRQAAVFLHSTYRANVISAFHLARTGAAQADLFRLCLLAERGGIYADADDVLYGPLETLLGEGRGLILVRDRAGGVVSNSFIAAAPGHPVLRRAAAWAVDAMLERSEELEWTKTGPGLLTRALGHVLAKGGLAGQGLTLIEGPDFARVVAAGRPAPYKLPAPAPRDAREAGRLWPRIAASLAAHRVPRQTASK